MKRMTKWLLPLLMLLPATAGYSAFTDDLTVDSKIAFVGDSWTSGDEFPVSVGGSNYVAWDTTGYLSQGADWAWKLCRNVGWREYRVFATGGQTALGASGITKNNSIDALNWGPDLAFIMAGINDCPSAPDLAGAQGYADQITDSLQAAIDRFHNAGSKVCVIELYPCGQKYTIDSVADSCRVAINTWVNALSQDDDLLVHRDQWVIDSLGGNYADSGGDSVRINPSYTSDSLHLTRDANYMKGDSIWVNSLGELSFGLSAQTYYVNSSTGDDWENTGTTSAAPFLTLQGALVRAGAGDYVQMAAGEYAINQDTGHDWYSAQEIKFLRTGTAANRINVYGNASTYTDTLEETRYFNTAYLRDSCYVTLHDLTFTDYTYALDHDNCIGLRFDDCSFIGSGVTMAGSGYIELIDCSFIKNPTHSTGNLIYVSDCDSLIVVGGDFDVSTGGKTGCVYITSGLDATDVIRFSNCDFFSDGNDTRCIYTVNGPTGVFELHNSILRNSSGYAIILYPSYDEDIDCNFFDGNLHSGVAVSISGWRSNTGGDNQWDYAPSVSDSIRYGGALPVRYEFLSRDHTSDWASIGTTQYAAPTIPERFATPTDSDSLVDYVGWVWSAGDTIRVTEWTRFIPQHKLELELDTGVPSYWRGGWN